MESIGPVYMIIKRSSRTGFSYVHTSGRNSTPFTTFSLGAAKALRTKLIQQNSSYHYRIIEIDIVSHRVKIEIDYFD